MSRTLSGLVSGDTDLDINVSLADVPASILTSGQLSVDRIPTLPTSKIQQNQDLNIGTGQLTTAAVVSTGVSTNSLTATGNITASGFITATGNIVSSATITGNNIISTHGLTSTGLNTQGGDISTAEVGGLTGNVTCGHLTTTGVTASGNINAGTNALSCGAITTSGALDTTSHDVTCGHLTTTGITASGEINADTHHITAGEVTTDSLAVDTVTKRDINASHLTFNDPTYFTQGIDTNDIYAINPATTINLHANLDALSHNVIATNVTATNVTSVGVTATNVFATANLEGAHLYVSNPSGTTIVMLGNLPTSNTNLSTGQVYNDNGTLKIV